MTWVLYEVWSLIDNQEALVDTTGSLKEAERICNAELDDGALKVTIKLEDDQGDVHHVKTVYS